MNLNAHKATTRICQVIQKATLAGVRVEAVRVLGAHERHGKRHGGRVGGLLALELEHLQGVERAEETRQQQGDRSAVAAVSGRGRGHEGGREGWVASEGETRCRGTRRRGAQEVGAAGQACEQLLYTRSMSMVL